MNDNLQLNKVSKCARSKALRAFLAAHFGLWIIVVMAHPAVRLMA